MVTRQRTTRPANRTGFTLVEILLVISLLALLIVFALPVFRSDPPYKKLDRSADRLSSLLAMCRAEAMLQGHPFRITWPTVIEDKSAPVEPIVMHEADPVGAPGQYIPMAAAWAAEPVIESAVDVRLVQSGTFDIADLSGTKGKFAVPSEPSRLDIQFRPDGTADPMVLVLTTPSGNDDQGELQEWVILDEITGLSKVQSPPTADQYDAMLAQQTDLPDLQFQEKAVEVVTQNQPGDQTLASLLSGGAGGSNLLSSSDLQQIMSALQPLMNSTKKSGTSASQPGTSSASGGRNTGSGNNPGRGPNGNNSGGNNSGRAPGGNPNAGNNPGTGNNPNNPGNNNNNNNRNGGNSRGGGRSGGGAGNGSGGGRGGGGGRS